LNNQVNKGFSIPLIPTVAVIITVTFKLTGLIDWNWVWVLFPLWVGPVIGIACFMFFTFMFLVGLFVGACYLFVKENSNGRLK
jgi:hypothetical protein